MNLATQQDIFQWHANFSNELGHFIDPHDIRILKDKFPEYQVIEVWLAMFNGESRWIHVGKMLDDLIEAYGTKLIPYAKERLENPLHGGGTSYGAAHLEAYKERCKQFCLMILQRLTGSK